MSLRARVREDMKKLNLRDWSFSAQLVGPNGVIYKTDAETGDQLKAIQVLSDKKQFTPDEGEDQIVMVESATFARDSLAVIPQAGERWLISVQFEPGGPLLDRWMDDSRPPEDGKSIGFITLFLKEVSQS